MRIQITGLYPGRVRVVRAHHPTNKGKFHSSLEHCYFSLKCHQIPPFHHAVPIYGVPVNEKRTTTKKSWIRACVTLIKLTWCHSHLQLYDCHDLWINISCWLGGSPLVVYFYHYQFKNAYTLCQMFFFNKFMFYAENLLVLSEIFWFWSLDLLIWATSGVGKSVVLREGIECETL